VEHRFRPGARVRTTSYRTFFDTNFLGRSSEFEVPVGSLGIVLNEIQYNALGRNSIYQVRIDGYDRVVAYSQDALVLDSIVDRIAELDS